MTTLPTELRRTGRLTGVPGRRTARGATSVWVARNGSAGLGRRAIAVELVRREDSLLPNPAKGNLRRLGNTRELPRPMRVTA
jgi:hypothetical protein